MAWDAETLDALDRLALAGVAIGATIAGKANPTAGTLSVPAGPRPLTTTINSSVLLVAVALGLYFLLK